MQRNLAMNFYKLEYPEVGKIDKTGSAGLASFCRWMEKKRFFP